MHRHSTTLWVLLAAVVVSLPASVWAWEIGVAPATRKILPHTAMPDAMSVELFAARGEWEAFQIVVRDTGGVEDVDVTFTDLAGPDGATLSAAEARLYREHFVEVTEPSPGSLTFHAREPGLYPDPLIPFFDPYADVPVPVGAPFGLAPEETGVVFVDWYVPADTPPASIAAALP